MESKITSCRICRSTELEDFLDLGLQALTGVFPANADDPELHGALVLCRCTACGLVQLRAEPVLTDMYGDNYGYRSGLNKSMVDHLSRSVADILEKVDLMENDLVIDIGSNDSTLLRAYPKHLNLELVGVDPVGEKFIEFYPDYVSLIPDFFPSQQLSEKTNNKKAKVITSFSCFYDIEAPLKFAQDIAEKLDDDGLWIFEQSYLPLMVERLSYDTVCHEHLEYYALKQIKYIADQSGLILVDVSFNDVNGGSFCVTAAKRESRYVENTKLIKKILDDEEQAGCNGPAYYESFAKNVLGHREKLRELLIGLKEKGMTISGLGASTKGNVMLQYCSIDNKFIDQIGEVNPYKFGRCTPGTHIPICDENLASVKNSNYKMVLPWHFRETFIRSQSEFIAEGGHLIFPLPKIEIYPAER